MQLRVLPLFTIDSMNTVYLNRSSQSLERGARVDGPGRAVPYALFQLQERAELFVSPGDEVYEGMIVGENARDNDLVVNPTKEKKLTNVRASGSDENVILKPPRQLFLEAALNTSKTMS